MKKATKVINEYFKEEEDFKAALIKCIDDCLLDNDVKYAAMIGVACRIKTKHYKKFNFLVEP